MSRRGRGAGVVVVPMLGQVMLEARERRELLADAQMAGGEHREGIVERGGVAAGEHRVRHGKLSCGSQRRASAPQGDLASATDTM